MDEYCKCGFCKNNNDFLGCLSRCSSFDGFSPDRQKIIDVAKEKGITIADMIALINLED